MSRVRKLFPQYQAKPRLEHHQTLKAYKLWQEGLDTLDIAVKLGVDEAKVYNSLAGWDDIEE